MNKASIIIKKQKKKKTNTHTHTHTLYDIKMRKSKPQTSDDKI